MLSGERASAEIGRGELGSSIGKKGITALNKKIDDALRRNLSFFEIIQMQFEEERWPMRRQERGRTFDGLVFIAFDIELDEIRNNAESGGRRLDRFDRDLDRRGG